jgi:hypothetical protein
VRGGGAKNPVLPPVVVVEKYHHQLLLRRGDFPVLARENKIVHEMRANEGLET